MFSFFFCSSVQVVRVEQFRTNPLTGLQEPNGFIYTISNGLISYSIAAGMLAQTIFLTSNSCCRYCLSFTESYVDFVHHKLNDRTRAKIVSLLPPMHMSPRDPS